MPFPSEEGTHTITFPLAVICGDSDVIYKRFGIIGHIHNVVVKRGKALLEQIFSDEEYIALRKEYGELASVDSDEAEKQLKSIKKRMKAIQDRYGLTESGLQKYAKLQGKMFAKNLSSQQVQKEASRVWKGICDVLYGKGKRLHFKPYREITTICGKSPKNGVKFFSRYHNLLNDSTDVLFEDGQIEWNGLIVRVKINYDDPYVAESLQHNIRYCEVKRIMFPNGYRYYVTVYLQGNAPKKLVPGDAPLCEIDPGVSTVAMYSEKAVMLRELAPKAMAYQREICRLQNQVDECKRRMNPENYNADGTVKRGSHKWKLSKTARQKQRMINVLFRKEAAYRKCSHNRLANEIIRISPHVRTEPMDFRALQKRAKKTERQEKESIIRAKDGSTRSIRKYKRKKRFGASIRTRAPAMFYTILEKKTQQYGGSFGTIDTRRLKPSQYDHVSNTYVKLSLSQRSKTVGGRTVQRDLYAAFIGYCATPDGKTFNHEKANALFEQFVIAQNKEIASMKAHGISMPQCFGF